MLLSEQSHLPMFSQLNLPGLSFYVSLVLLFHSLSQGFENSRRIALILSVILSSGQNYGIRE